MTTTYESVISNEARDLSLTEPAPGWRIAAQGLISDAVSAAAMSSETNRETSALRCAKQKLLTALDQIPMAGQSGAELCYNGCTCEVKGFFLS
jgi:hypothetical protein